MTGPNKAKSGSAMQTGQLHQKRCKMCFLTKSCQAPSEVKICLSHCKQWKYIVEKYGVFTPSKLLF